MRRGITLLSVVILLCVTVAYTHGRQREANCLEKQIGQLVDGGSNDRSPGWAVLVRKNGRTVFQARYGVRELRTRKAIDSQTNFRLASCTKQFTAMAVMLLVHDGRLRYDDQLTNIFPDFPEYGRLITIRNLLNHTSGLPDYEELMFPPSFVKVGQWTETHQIRDAEVLALLKEQNHGKFAPGTQWSYSNSGYVVLGLVIAKVSGKPFENFLDERIFKPLEMNHTLAYVKGKNEFPDRAYGHSKEDTAFKQTDQDATSATLGDGGIYSNLEDLARWDDALEQHLLLSAADMQQAFTAVRLADGSQPYWSSGPGDTDPQAGKPVSYGFGWFLDPYQGHQRMWHYGDTIGFKTAIERLPEDKLTIVLLANRSDLDPVVLMSKVADLFLTPARSVGCPAIAGSLSVAQAES